MKIQDYVQKVKKFNKEKLFIETEIQFSKGDTELNIESGTLSLGPEAGEHEIFNLLGQYILIKESRRAINVSKLREKLRNLQFEVVAHKKNYTIFPNISNQVQEINPSSFNKLLAKNFVDFINQDSLYSKREGILLIPNNNSRLNELLEVSDEYETQLSLLAREAQVFGTWYQNKMTGEIPDLTLKNKKSYVDIMQIENEFGIDAVLLVSQFSLRDLMERCNRIIDYWATNKNFKINYVIDYSLNEEIIKLLVVLETNENQNLRLQDFIFGYLGIRIISTKDFNALKDLKDAVINEIILAGRPLRNDYNFHYQLEKYKITPSSKRSDDYLQLKCIDYLNFAKNKIDLLEELMNNSNYSLWELRQSHFNTKRKAEIFSQIFSDLLISFSYYLVKIKCRTNIVSMRNLIDNPKDENEHLLSLIKSKQNELINNVGNFNLTQIVEFYRKINKIVNP